MPALDRRLAGRLVLESLVIVASILAAFALDRWWESVQLRAEEREVLAALDAEFRVARSQLEASLELHRRTLGSVGFLRTALDESLRAGDDFVTLPDTALGWLYIPPTTQLTLGTLDGLVGSARLGVIREGELRSALAAWGSTLNELTEEERDSRDYVLTALDGVFRTRVNVNPFRWIIGDALGGVLSSDELARGSRIPADEEILGVVATRYALLDHGVDEFAPVFDEIDRILALIARSR
jgi:hypothetical protein